MIKFEKHKQIKNFIFFPKLERVVNLCRKTEVETFSFTAKLYLVDGWMKGWMDGSKT